MYYILILTQILHYIVDIIFIRYFKISIFLISIHLGSHLITAPDQELEDDQPNDIQMEIRVNVV